MIREYQTIAEANILEALDEHDRIMFSMGTGLGKTQIVTDLLKPMIYNDIPCLFIAHRQELISQAWSTFHRHRIESGIIQSGIKPNHSFPCQIGSIQTMIRRNNLPHAKYIFVDEGHHSLDDNSYGRLIQQEYPKSKIIAITATPYRLSGKGFTKLYSKLVESLQLAEGIDQGFLVSLRYFACPSPDMAKVHLSGGDYKEDEAVKAMELVPIVESYLEHARGKIGICFAINISHSRKIVDQYLAAGVRAEHVDANTPNDIRAAIFKRLRDRVTQMVVNVGIATEGVDIPAIEVVQCCRPTKSLALWLQMIGRGTRVANDLIKDSLSAEERKLLIAASDKSHLIILDNAGLFHDHRMMPDQAIDWQKHFRGWKKEKKPIEEMIEIFIAEDESGREIRTKIPKEIEGLKLIEITHQEKEKVINLQSLKEFDRLYSLFKNIPKIAKPGFKAYFEYRDYCRKNSILMNEDVWEYLKLRLSTKAKEDEINERYEITIKLINERYSGDGFLLDKVNENNALEILEIKRVGVPEGFLRKEKEKFELKGANQIKKEG